MSEVERLLQYALAPVEPPGRMSERLEHQLTLLTDAAVDEIAEWDPSALRDPRRWARLMVAGAVGAGAGGALILVRAQQKRRHSEAHGVTALTKGMREVTGDARRRLKR